MYLFMDTFGAWVESRRKAMTVEGKPVSIGVLAERAGISRGHLNNIEKGRFLPEGGDVIAGLARALAVSPQEVEDRIRLERAGGIEGFRRMAGLLAREGELPEAVPTPSPKVVDLKDRLGLSTGATINEDWKAPWEKPEYLRVKPAPKLVKLRYYGKVGAFKKRLPETADDIEVTEKQAKGVDYAVQAAGDSMDDLDHPKLPPIPDGALLFVKRNESPKVGAVVIAALGDDTVQVKLLQRGRDGLYLVSASREKTYPRIPVDDRVVYLGEVVGVGKHPGQDQDVE